MFRRTFETSEAPVISVTECKGDLVIRGSELPQVGLRLRNGATDADVRQEGDAITISTRSDCSITCPIGATINIQAVRGDMRVKGVSGAISFDTVNGDVVLRDVGPAVLGHIHGDLSVRHGEGPMTVDSVAGDAYIRTVEGPLTIQTVGGSLKADGLQGGLDAQRVGSDIVLGPPFPPGTAFRVNAGSDLVISLPLDAGLRMTLQSGGRVRSTIPDVELVERNGVTEAVTGSGEATLEAQAGGHIRLRPAEAEGEPEIDLGFVADIEGLGVEIEARIADAMADMEARLSESLAMVDSETLRLKIGRATERAQRATERAAGQARRAAEQEAERARMRAERAERRWQRASGQRPTPPAPPRSPVGDEERVRVLRLVEEGRITPEQAIDLLSALEGR